MAPDFAQISFAILGEEGSERRLFEEGLVFLGLWWEEGVHFPAAMPTSICAVQNFLIGQVLGDLLVNVVRIPCCLYGTSQYFRLH